MSGFPLLLVVIPTHNLVTAVSLQQKIGKEEIPAKNFSFLQNPFTVTVTKLAQGVLTYSLLATTSDVLEIAR